MERTYSYGVCTNANQVGAWEDECFIDWYDTIGEALAAAREAIDDGTKADAVEVMKFWGDTGEVAWDAAIRLDEEGRAWSDDYDAREEMGFIQ